MTFASIPLAKASCLTELGVSMDGTIQEWMWEIMNKLGHAVIVNSMEKFLEDRDSFGELEILKQRFAGR